MLAVQTFGGIVLKRFFLFVLGALSACTTLELGNNTNFKMVTPTSFQFDDVANRLEPADSIAAEQKRISRVEAFLRVNDACPSGYEVTNRTKTVIGQFGSSSAMRIYYEGRCK